MFSGSLKQKNPAPGLGLSVVRESARRYPALATGWLRRAREVMPAARRAELGTQAWPRHEFMGRFKQVAGCR